MKILTVAIPCYNSENYMRKCIESLLPGGEEVEIIIVDDGSKDSTGIIADEYAAKYPFQVKAIHQENGGHGEAVNTGINNASGLYYKVVDSDDWVNEEAYLKILETMKNLLNRGEMVDMFLSNFVYEKEGQKRKKIMRYKSALPQEKIFTWKDIKRFHLGQYILMHSVIYRTQMLKDCGLILPKHTFYVDNIFVYYPLPSVKKMYYLNVNFYRYYIGREDQSVNEKVMISRIDQQINVTKIMLDDYNIWKIVPVDLRKYMISYLEIMMTVSSIMLIRANTPEDLEKKKDLWQYLKQKDYRLYFRIRHGILGRYMNLPGKSGRKMSIVGYKITNHFFGFN